MLPLLLRKIQHHRNNLWNSHKKKLTIYLHCLKQVPDQFLVRILFCRPQMFWAPPILLQKKLRSQLRHQLKMLSTTPISSIPISDDYLSFNDGDVEVFQFALKINSVKMFTLKLSYQENNYIPLEILLSTKVYILNQL